MVIDPKNNVNNHRSGDAQGQNNRQVANQQPVPSAPDKSGPSKEDTVVLSNQAKAIKGLEEKIIKQTTVSQKRVEEIKAAIARGEYPINYERVAEKLLDYEELFLK